MATNRSLAGPILQARDERVFVALLESRVMTREQLACVYFGGSYDMAKKRLAKLIAAGYISEQKPRASYGHYFPALLSLSRKGFDALAASGGLAAFPNMTWDHVAARFDLARATLAHEVELVDCKVAFTKAVDGEQYLSLEEFVTWPALFQFESEDMHTGKRFTQKPDAFVIVSEDGDAEHSFFVEYDRATEAGRQLMRKAWAYHRFYTSGGFARRSGAPIETFAEYPFRVLYIFPNEERRNVVAERLLQIHQPDDRERRAPLLIKNQHWLTTQRAFLADPLGPIWLTLDAYWDASEGTVYDPRCHFTMKRTSARDRLIADRVPLCQLFPAKTAVARDSSNEPATRRQPEMEIVT